LFFRTGTTILHNVGSDVGCVALDTAETLRVRVMGEHEIVFNAREMKIVEVTCHKCGVGSVLDCSNEKSGIPRGCPGCGLVDETLFAWLNGYRKWYQAIAGSQYKFSFRVPLRDKVGA
jgi:hypothetical protein